MPEIKNLTIFLRFLMSRVINQSDRVSDKSEKRIATAFDK